MFFFFYIKKQLPLVNIHYKINRFWFYIRNLIDKVRFVIRKIQICMVLVLYTINYACMPTHANIDTYSLTNRHILKTDIYSRPHVRIHIRMNQNAYFITRDDEMYNKMKNLNIEVILYFIYCYGFNVVYFKNIYRLQKNHKTSQMVTKSIVILLNWLYLLALTCIGIVGQ